jgi:tRNA threonylcarbamoyladenosine dehydratase
VSSFVCPDRFTRTVDLYGAAGFARIRAAAVVVCGLGGVGSHAALALARSGVGRLTLIDFDPVTASSLNRSPCATVADVGRPKVEVVGDFLRATCPDTAVDGVAAFFHTDTADALLAPPPTCVVDAIDALNPKVELLAACVARGIPVVSSMGAAGRTDVSFVRAGDLWESRRCPLAGRVRKYLRRRGVTAPIPCVWSEEEPADALAPDLDDPRFERGRIRNRLPSGIAMPGVFGYTLASLALDLAAGRESGG